MYKLLTKCITIFLVLIVVSACQSQSIIGPFGTPIAPPSEGKATLTGILVKAAEGDEPEKPYYEVRLLAGIPVYDSEGNVVAGQVGFMESPKANTDIDGRFAFIDLEPGTYFLVLHMPPLELIKLNDPTTGEDMFFELKAGEIKDIGKLAYTDLYYWLEYPAE